MKSQLAFCCAITLICSLVCFSGQADQPEKPTLIRHAVLPAQTWGDGPPCGAFDSYGRRHKTAPFHTQPVQGISSLRPLPQPNRWLALSDNGFGNMANSPDYLLRVYVLAVAERTNGERARAAVEVMSTLTLNDRNRRVPFLIVNENTEDRLLTGADFDPESLVLVSDGSLWIGDEFGPFLLHFGANGTLLVPPIEIPNLQPDGKLSHEPLRSPHHPVITARGTEPGAIGSATVRASGGIEGLAQLPSTSLLLIHIEKTVLGDPEGLLRIYEFDSENSHFTGVVFRYQLECPEHRIGELTAVSDHHLLVIERDDGEGENAKFKRVYRIEIDRTSPTSPVSKHELVDLMDIDDPERVGGSEPIFTFPYATIESVLMVAPDTLLIANDNNFNSQGARGPGIPNDSELIWVRLPTPVVPLSNAPGQH